MSRYQLFIAAFMVNIIAAVVLLSAHFYNMFHLISSIENDMGHTVNPSEFFSAFFSPLWIISLLVTMACGLLYQVLGIIFIAKNEQIESGEKALWIVGFVIFGFITAIVFMALCKSRNLINEVSYNKDKGPESQF